MDKLSLAEVAQVTGAETNSDAEIFFEGVSTDSRKIKDGMSSLRSKAKIVTANLLRRTHSIKARGQSS